MTTLNTIIEEEIEKFDTKNPALAWKENNHLHDAITSAMQRAYEDGYKEGYEIGYSNGDTEGYEKGLVDK